MENKGDLRAFDLHENRVRLIRNGAKRLGLEIINASANNAKVFNAELPQADRVLCDVPCSGFGVIRRKPEIKYKNPSDFDRLPDVQYEILDTCSRYVKVGGTLIYSTCTVSRAENDGVAEKFLENHSEFCAGTLPEPLGGGSEDFKVTITPDRFNSDGFFIAKFVRMR
jgi:16S rRNA (cytosine967-C5)-methyltransferase